MYGSKDIWIQATTDDAVAYARKMLKDHAAAEDVVQDCYCRLLAKAHVYDLQRDGRKILFEAVHNACLNRLTRTKPTLSLDGLEGDKSFHDILADSSARCAEEVMLDQEFTVAFEAAMSQLLPLQRTALELKLADRSLREIADEMNITPTYAGVLIHRARQALAGELAGWLETEVATCA
jgi:RNA polymerase sigma-70 factor (ECF subfamily)